MSDDNIAPILAVIEKATFTDIALRPGQETRVKTPKGWLPISVLAQGAEPHRPTREWLVQFIAEMRGDEDWLKTMGDQGASLAFMFPFSPKEIRLRCKVALCADTTGDGSDFIVHLRNLPMKIPPLGTLGLPPGLNKLLTPAGGLVIITGSVGSGKTTTMASLVQNLNETRYSNVIALESLSEYLFPPGNCMITQRTVPKPVPTFLQGIRDALDGQAVDVLMIGEVVDQSTMDAMLRAAESGHLVIATMHARNAVGAISRIVDMFPAAEQSLRLNTLADKLVGVIAQKLIPTVSGEDYALAYEVLTNATPAVTEAIRSNNSTQLQSQMQTGGEHGMFTLNQVLRRLIQDKKIERATGLAVSYDKSELDTLLRTRAPT